MDKNVTDRVKFRRQFFYELDEYFINDQDNSKSSEPKSEPGDLPPRTPDKDKSENKEADTNEQQEKLQLKAINFTSNYGVKAMIGEVICGMGKRGEAMKGTKIRVILPPDCSIKYAAAGNIYEIFSPTFLDDKLTRLQIADVVL